MSLSVAHLRLRLIAAGAIEMDHPINHRGIGIITYLISGQVNPVTGENNTSP